MPIFETHSGTRLDIALPNTDWPELQKAVEEYRELQKERKVAAHRLDALATEQHKAVERDKQELARWMRDKKGPEPKANAAEKVEKEIVACRRRYDALDIALEEAGIDLIHVVDEHRDEWTAEVAGRITAAMEKFEEALDVVVDARTALAREYALRRWVENFPEQASFRLGVPSVRSLTSPSGDPYMWDQVVAAIRRDAEPATPTVIPWGAAATQALRQAT
jgi:hypothetical protein